MTLQRGVGFAVAGLAWGGFAWLLGRRAFGPELWGATLLSPLIGLLVGGLLQDRFERHQGWRRGAVALISLYVAATLFGIGLGIAAFLESFGGGAAFFSRVAEHTLGVWWGITLTGFLLFLWPMTYATHWYLEWRELS